MRLKDSSNADALNAVQQTLVNMKRSPAEKKSKDPSMISSPNREDYPYGLNISLDDDGLSKLGLTDMPGVGDTFDMTAKVKVTRVSSNASEDSNTSRDVSLQITDMALEASGQDDESADDGDSEGAQDSGADEADESDYEA